LTNQGFDLARLALQRKKHRASLLKSRPVSLTIRQTLASRALDGNVYTLTLFSSAPAQPAPCRYEESTVRYDYPFDGDTSPILFSDSALIIFIGLPANAVADVKLSGLVAGHWWCVVPVGNQTRTYR
jgi:hypothetical protein